ncbi:MAG: hypothetical protein JJU29_18780 [Verrucomicrobia bacterium]|nr:hypothetical protein [Verrucomicrobiota bacterium]MCH8510099.1 hypothetical protein [Kiritimatiellia bacterium]
MKMKASGMRERYLPKIGMILILWIVGMPGCVRHAISQRDFESEIAQVRVDLRSRRQIVDSIAYFQEQEDAKDAEGVEKELRLHCPFECCQAYESGKICFGDLSPVQWSFHNNRLGCVWLPWIFLKSNIRPIKW